MEMTTDKAACVGTVSTREWHHFDIILWQSKEDFIEATEQRGADACHCPAPVKVERDGTLNYPCCLGTIHFIAGKWDEEAVAHECAHAALQASRALGVNPLNQDDMQGNEERFCYMLGAMTGAAYRWLWERDPNKKWKKDQP